MPQIKYLPHPERRTEAGLLKMFGKVKIFRCLGCNPSKILKLGEVVPHLISVHSVAMIQPAPAEKSKPARKRVPREK